MQSRGVDGLIAVCFFLSGAAGLIYQVVWLRMLSLVLGHTVLAATAVLAAFMAGLALGGWLFSRWADRAHRPVALYGAVEIVAGLFCALLPVLLPLAAGAAGALAGALSLSPGPAGLVEFGFAAALLLVPTTLLGGTLPLLAQALGSGSAPAAADRASGAGRWLGSLYALNTAGAVVGAAAAGYVLLPWLGNRRTLFLASAISIGVGIACLAWGRRTSSPTDGPPARVRAQPGALSPETAPAGGSSAAGLAFLAVAGSGAVAMLYEVAWTRALTLVIGNSTYAFSAMLIAFLAGIAGGSALYAWLLGRRPVSLPVLGLIQSGVGAATVAVVLVFDRFPALLAAWLRWSDAPVSVQLFQLGISVLALLPATLGLGATFPCAGAIVSRGRVRAGRDAGELFAVNTLGAVLGAVSAGLTLLPGLGVQATLLAGVSANFALGALLLARAPRAARWRGPARAAAALVLALAGAVGLAPRWDDKVMASGPAVYARAGSSEAAESPWSAELRRSEILFHADGATATVVVTEHGRERVLRINGKVDASTGRDMHTQLMSGHLPMFLHASPRSVLVIGLGSGVTVGAIARHRAERVVVAEIEPAVVQAAGLFAHVHGNVLADPRVRVAATDARRLLRSRPERYDVIVSEPSNPWIGGMAALFTVEFFELARDRLEPGGIMVQWVQLYGLVPDDLRMVVNTFRAAFPATSVWHTSSGDLLLVGRAAVEAVDTARLRARFPAAAADLGPLGVGAWPGVLGYALLDEDGAARFAAGAGLNEDDALPLEFSAPRSLRLRTGPANHALLRAHRRGELPRLTAEGRRDVDTVEARTWIGRAALARGASPEALPHLERARALDPEHLGAALGLCTALLNLGRTAEAMDLAEHLVARHPGQVDALLLAGLAAGRAGQAGQAVRLLERAVAADPGNELARLALSRARQRAAPGQ